MVLATSAQMQPLRGEHLFPNYPEERDDSPFCHTVNSLLTWKPSQVNVPPGWPSHLSASLGWGKDELLKAKQLWFLVIVSSWAGSSLKWCSVNISTFIQPQLHATHTIKCTTHTIFPCSQVFSTYTRTYNISGCLPFLSAWKFWGFWLGFSLLLHFWAVYFSCLLPRRKYFILYQRKSSVLPKCIFFSPGLGLLTK